MPINIGFTGCRAGPTIVSRKKFIEVIQRLSPDIFHHGACVGWDEESVVIVRRFFWNCQIIAHPGISAKARHGDKNPDRSEVAMKLSDKIEREDTHFSRNRTIVNLSDWMVGCPPTFEVQDKGGTWYTIGYAEGQNKPISIITPDGEERHKIKP